MIEFIEYWSLPDDGSADRWLVHDGNVVDFFHYEKSPIWCAKPVRWFAQSLYQNDSVMKEQK